MKCMEKMDAVQKNLYICRFVLIVLTIAVFGVSLRNGFVWDENIFLVNNPNYRDFNLRAILFSLGDVVEYYPLTAVTFALNFKIWGANPFGFHLTNLLFLIGNVLVVHYLADVIVKKCAALSGQPSSWFAPFAVAALFALHPINSEPANWIGARNVLVSGLFFFLSIVFMLRYLDKPGPASPKLYLAAIFAFVCAMLSKATVIVLPVLLVAILPLLFPGRMKRIVVAVVPFFAVALGFFLFLKKIADSVGLTNANAITSFSSKGVRALQIPTFYLKKLLFPYGFSVEYEPGFAENLFTLRAGLAAAVILLLLGAAFLTRRRFVGISVGICWFLVALLPVLNFFSTHPVVADRYAYLPSFGFMLGLGLVLDSLPQQRFKLLLFVPIVCILAAISVNRSLDWRSDETLWSANIRNFPNNTKSYVNLANYYFRGGDQQRALDLLSGNSNVPNLNGYYYLYKGEQLFQQNRLSEAKEQFQFLVDRIESSFTPALFFLGQIAVSEGDYISAAYYYNRALNSQLKDYFFLLPAIKSNLQELRKNWLDQYLNSVSQGVAQSPAELGPRRKLALTLDQLGFYKDALEQYLALEQRGVKGWQIYQNIANCYFNINKSSDAARYYEKVIALGGVSEDAYNNLGISYRKLEQYDNSIKVLESGSRQFPEASFLAYNLAVTYKAAGMKAKARSSFEEVNKKFPDMKGRIVQHLLELSN